MSQNSSDPMFAVLLLAISAGIGYVLYRRAHEQDRPRLSGFDYSWGSAPVLKSPQPPRVAERVKQVAKEYGPKAYSAAKKGAGVAAKHVGKASKAAYGYAKVKAPVAGRAAYGLGKEVYRGVRQGAPDFDPRKLISRAKSKKTVFGEPVPEALQLPRRAALGQAPTVFAGDRRDAYTVPGKRGAVQRRGVAKTISGDEYDPRLLAAIERGGYEENRKKRRKKGKRR